MLFCLLSVRLRLLEPSRYGLAAYSTSGTHGGRVAKRTETGRVAKRIEALARFDVRYRLRRCCSVCSRYAFGYSSRLGTAWRPTRRPGFRGSSSGAYRDRPSSRRRIEALPRRAGWGIGFADAVPCALGTPSATRAVSVRPDGLLDVRKSSSGREAPPTETGRVAERIEALVRRSGEGTADRGRRRGSTGSGWGSPVAGESTGGHRGGGRPPISGV